MDQLLYSKALLFAEQAHRGQVRKGTEVPYITHPVGVSALLAQHGCSEDAVIAGLLHDVLEDTPTTLEDLARKRRRGTARRSAGRSGSRSPSNTLRAPTSRWWP
jgi:(p)ppGpp synthase/HD superfamily hydrolase